MALHEDLASEVSRVVSCQYAVSLKPLHTLLRQSDAFTVRRWAGGHPCQIPKLAAAVGEALQTWPYALEILQKLVQSKLFRDAFLDQHPAILEAFLGKATSAHCSEEVFETCIAFLTEPLPATIPLPASAQSFLVETFKKATRSPTEHSYALVFTLLDGACRDLVGVLPRDIWDQFQDYNWELLKRKDLEKYTTVATLCFGISVPLGQPQSKRLEASWSSSRSLMSSNPTAPISAEDHLTLPRLFGTDRGRSVTRLMVGNALLWCGENVTSIDDPAVRNMRIASQVVSLVPEEVRLSWSRDHYLWTDKLLGKVLQPGIHPMLQLQALTIVALLHQANNIPARAVSAYEKVLLIVARTSPSARVLSETLSLSLGLFSPQINESFIKQILRESISACTHSSPQLDCIESLTLLLQYLSIAAMESDSVRKGILLAVSADDLQNSLQEFLASPSPKTILSEVAAVCSNTVQDATRKAGLATCSIILKSALAAQADEMGLSVPIGMSLLNKQQELAVPLSGCNHMVPSRSGVTSLSLVEQYCTQNTQSPSRDWRQRLAADLQKEDSKRSQLILRTLNEVCRDLETRCEETEGPLRQEKEKVEKLELRVDELEKENLELGAQASELESRELDRELYTEGLENEKKHAEAQIEHLTTSNQALEERFEGLKRKLREANETAESTVVAVRRDCDSRVSEIRAALASTERANEIEVLELRQRAADLEKALKCANEHLAQEKDAHNSLKEQVGALQTDLEQQNSMVMQQNDKLNEANLRSTTLSQELERLEQSTVKLHAEHEAMVSSLRADMDIQRNGLQEELRRYKEEAIKAQALLDEQLSSSRKNLESLRSQYESTCEELQAKKHAMSKLQQKVDKLADSYAEKEAQVREAEAFKTRILSAMGPSSVAFEQPETGPRVRRTRHSTIMTTQTPGKSSAGAQLIDANSFGSLELDEDTLPQGSNEKSFGSSGYSKSGPTPKRAKSHQQPFKVPSTKQAPKNLRSGTASQERPPTAAQRAPLLDVSVSRGNRSPVRRTTGSAKNVLFDEKPDFLAKDQDADDVMEDESFDDSDLFTSTPFVPQDPATSQPRALDEDTTVDM